VEVTPPRSPLGSFQQRLPRRSGALHIPCARPPAHPPAAPAHIPLFASHGSQPWRAVRPCLSGSAREPGGRRAGERTAWMRERDVGAHCTRALQPERRHVNGAAR
jgi:hypothetical protein